MTTRLLTGYGSVFGASYRVGGRHGFDEQVLRGAFTKTLGRRPDVVFRLEHGSLPFARTTSGTLTLSQDKIGLRYEASLNADDPEVQAFIPKIERGDMRESSFAFKIPEGGDSWNEMRTQRSIREADIHRGDVSLVTFGASSATGQYTSLRGSLSLEQRAARAALTRGVAIVRGYVTAVDGHELRLVGETIESEPDETVTPPNLRDAMDAAVACQTCSFYNGSEQKSRTMYAYAVQPTQLCDSYESGDDNDVDDRRKRARRTLLALDDSLDLLDDLRLRGRG